MSAGASFVGRQVSALRTVGQLAFNTRHQPQSTLDEAASALLVAALDQHAIECKRALHQALQTPRDVLFGTLDTAWISPRVRFHGHQLGVEKIGG